MTKFRSPLSLTSRPIYGALLLGLCWTLTASAALAQDDDDEAPEPPTFEDGMDLDTEDGAMVITGSEYLPEFTVIIDRENLSRAFEMDLDEPLLPKISEAVEHAPF
ncbi:MAG: hypothetical protein EA397_06580 [Deltaproteobacteria bacterium]|nr:MAG: hypothetical protein EA397_06580 [Deltaproteobacteria bacterium]